MYTKYYGLKEMPFDLTPNPKYIFITESYLEVLANLKYAIEYKKGLVAVTGEVGMGKTTALRSAIQQFDSTVLPVYIFNPYLNISEFLSQFSAGLGIPYVAGNPKDVILRDIGNILAKRHAQGLFTILIIDEAHGLSDEVLEEIRLLSNFETDYEKLLQIILCGQPELSTILNRVEMRQLKQRLSLWCSVKPLSRYETGKYIRFRLKIAEATRVDLFLPDAVNLIFEISQGTPRVINNICDNALLYGLANNQEMVSLATVEEVLASLNLSTPMLTYKTTAT